MANNRVIREILINSYNKEELITLTADITGNAEAVLSDGSTIATKARELVDWCARRKKTRLLIDQIKKDRPEVYKANQKQLEEKSESPLTEVQLASEEIEEVFGNLKETRDKNETVSPETAPVHTRKHPLTGAQSSVHAWFKNLAPSQQVFIVSAAFFNGLQRDELMYLYSDVLKLLDVSQGVVEKEEK